MKPILGVAALLVWFARCQDVDVPRHGHPHSHPWEPRRDAGQEEEPEPSYDASCETSQPDAAVEVPDAAVGETPDAAVEQPDSSVVVPDGGDWEEPDGSTTSGLDASIEPELPCNGPPGLYVKDSCEILSDFVWPYRPLYELWSDGATKQRFIYLPPGGQIDTSDADRWNFPLGTRLYKTFTVAGLRIETRVIEKTKTEPGIDSWTLVSYAWSADQKSVTLADAAGVPNALGTPHDIPTQAQCKTCHTMTKQVPMQVTDPMTGVVATMNVAKPLDAVNGFSAIQLNYDYAGAGMSLRELLAAGRLYNSTGGQVIDLAGSKVPGDDVAQAALGYLHANCGTCHGGGSPRANLALWSTVGVKPVSEAPAVRTSLCACMTRWTGRRNPAGDLYMRRIAAGHADVSGLLGRMSVRAMGEQMPPIGTELPDPAGLAAVRNWINGMEPTCDSLPACVSAQPPAAAPPPPAMMPTPM